MKAYPAPLGYMGFPKSCCVSVNDVICHGIPDVKALESGDIVSIDISLYDASGYFGDSCRTWIVGGEEAIDEAGRDLVTRSREIMMDAIDVCGPGVPFERVGDVIETKCETYGYESVRKFCGHSIGRSLHMTPLVLHYRDGYGFGSSPIMEPGMTFTVEPMICEGSEENETLSDGWTIVTADGRRASQFEHIVLITDDGYDILT